MQDLVFGPKKAQVTKTESENLVEDLGEGEAEDKTKQKSKGEQEKDAALKAE